MTPLEEFDQIINTIEQLLNDKSISSTYIAKHLDVETSTINRYRQGVYEIENMSLRISYDLYELALSVLPANQLLKDYNEKLKETSNFKGVKLAFDKAESGYFTILYDYDTKRVSHVHTVDTHVPETNLAIVCTIDLDNKPVLMTVDIKYMLTRVFDERMTKHG